MTAIQLTQEHKDKLIEMCWALFPHYNDILMAPIDEQYVLLVQHNKKPFYEYIHWYEFCLMHLATIFYNRLDSNERGFTILYYRGMIAQEIDHPIDYFYNEFKKLK